MQAIYKINNLKKIYLVEPDESSLIDKLLKFKMLNDKRIVIEKEFSKEILKSDLIVISTTSSPRFGIIQNLISEKYEGNILLEKFLYPNIETLLKAEHIFDNSKTDVFVNQWMRCTNLRNIFEGFEDGDITIKGKEIGILCNCVHYLDLINSF